MQRAKALGAVLVVALSVGLLVGCSSGSGTTSASTAPAADQLVGTWIKEHSDHTIGVLEFRADGTTTYSWGYSRGTVEEYVDGRYQADRESVTFLTTSNCGLTATDGATYTYKFVSDRVTFTNTSGDDKCRDRLEMMEETAFNRETAWLPVSSSSEQWASLIAKEEAAIRSNHEALEAWVNEAIYGGNAAQGGAFESELNSAASNVEGTAEALNEALVNAIGTLGQPPVEVSALVDSMLIATAEAMDAAFDTNEVCEGGDSGVQPECTRAALRVMGASAGLVSRLDAWAPYM